MGRQGGRPGRADYLELGDFNAACSECGRKRKATTLERNWQGLYRCPEHNEPRQPQDFARGIAEKPAAPWVQPELGSFAPLCTLNGQSAIPGVAIPGCMIPGNNYYDPYAPIPIWQQEPIPPAGKFVPGALS